MSIPVYINLNQTGDLSEKLVVCVGFIHTYHISVNDRLVNDSIGTVKYCNFNCNHPLLGSIYIKFDEQKAGNS